MYYYNPTVKQCLDRKGKPWRASIDYKDPITGKRKQKTKMLPGAKGKKEAKKMAEEWLAEMNDSVKTMAPVEQGKTLEEMIEGFENYRLTVGEIEKSTHQKNLAVSKNYIYDQQDSLIQIEPQVPAPGSSCLYSANLHRK